MNRTLPVVLALAFVLVFPGCGDDSGPSSSEGRFNGTLDGTNYDLPVTCSFLGSGFFMFLSDDDDITDTNMDGLIFSGFETNGNFTLTMMIDGSNYSVAGIESWGISGSTVSGSGILFLEGTAMSFPVTFTVMC